MSELSELSNTPNLTRYRMIEEHFNEVMRLAEMVTVSNMNTEQVNDEDNVRTCWVCFVTNEEELASWVQPCRCSGTTKWVHQTCLQRWVDEKQKGNTYKRVKCPQCQTEYMIVFPYSGQFVRLLESIEIAVKKVCPFFAAGIVVGAIYWTAVSYGAITVLQVVGPEQGLAGLEKCDPLLLLIGLPAIPVCLILGRMIRWEETVLRFIQNRQQGTYKFRLLSLVLPVPDENHRQGIAHGDDENNPPAFSTTTVVSEPASVSQIFCGALLMPTISSIIGRIFFDSIQNNFHRTIVGGLSFIAVKGALKIYFKHRQYVRKRQRLILNFTEENIQRFINSNATQASTQNSRRTILTDLEHDFLFR